MGSFFSILSPHRAIFPGIFFTTAVVYDNISYSAEREPSENGWISAAEIYEHIPSKHAIARNALLFNTSPKVHAGNWRLGNTFN